MKKIFTLSFCLILLSGAGCGRSADLDIAHQSHPASNAIFNLTPTGSVSVLKPGTPARFSFSITNNSGQVIKDFSLTHEKLLHLIVVSRDLASFQHLHPDYDKTTGAFTIPDLMFGSAGRWLLFADFSPAGSGLDAHGNPITKLAKLDITVGEESEYKEAPLGGEERTKKFGTYEVSLRTEPAAIVVGSETELEFTLKQNGRPLTNLEPYLGARGHSVILRADTLEYIHTHPHEGPGAPGDGKVIFTTRFDRAGRYKLFTQFKHQGKIITTDFVVSVSPATAGAKPATDHASMHH